MHPPIESPESTKSESTGSIGIFDSGIGGLTVFKALSALLPNENLLYLGDTARVPYGTKSPRTVTRYCLQNVRFLLDRKVKLIVVACNTASAFAMTDLRRELTLPVVGVVEPGVTGALRVTRNGKIGVIGTEGTIQSGIYTTEIQKRGRSAKVWGTACPLFVPLVEEGLLGGEIPLAVARRYLTGITEKGIDTLILGCTHYPLLKSVIREVTGPGIELVDSAEETAQEVARLLDAKKLFNDQNRSPRGAFFVTDHPERFQKVGTMFLGTPLANVQQIDV